MPRTQRTLSALEYAGKLRLWFDTVRWLKPSQTVGRVWYRVARPTLDTSPAAPRRPTASSFAGCQRKPEMIAEDTFVLLGEKVRIPAAGSWEGAHPNKLVRYHLNYFDDLVGDEPGARRSWHRKYVQSWLDGHPPMELGTAWEPYPVSLRLVNWIKTWLSDCPLGDATLEERMTQSAATQARWLRKRLERHLLGNHLWANAKALVFVGAAYSNGEADEWLKTGTRIMRAQIAEQVMDDGGHFERSPMYQATLLEDLLDLVQLARCFPNSLHRDDIQLYRSTSRKMLRWLQAFTHPDGDIVQFNDAALGMAPKTASLVEYARRLDVPVDSLPHNELFTSTGYARLDQGPATLFVDVAPVGPDYIPGHAHADTLCCEMSLHGQRLFVDGGTSTYERGRLREQERGTTFHNTISIDQCDSSEVWASFRVGRRARPFDLSSSFSAENSLVEAAHDGYRRLSNPVTHRRRWCLTQQQLVIEDQLEGRAKLAEARFRIHPDWAVISEGDAITISFDTHRVAVHLSGLSDSVRVEDSHWARGFSDRQPCQVLVMPFDERLVSRFTWNEK